MALSPAAALHLPHISPISPLYLPHISRAAMALSPAAAAVRCASFSASSSAFVCGRYRGDMGRCGAELEQSLALAPSPNP